MSLNTTPAAERTHIGIFGRRNAGKSSLINAITGQALAIVSPIKGTTTDPVFKTMELLPLGPVILMDTPGLDDTGDLGAMRVQKTHQILNKTDIAILVVDATLGLTAQDHQLLERIKGKGIPHLIALNKADQLSPAQKKEPLPPNALLVSSATGENIDALKELLATKKTDPLTKTPLVADLLNAGDFVVLVVPIDSSAPKGRLILPQQQTIRDVLEAGATALVVRNTELAQTLASMGKPPRMVITDSQAFGQVAALVPANVPLTSFSMLFARYKGDLEATAAGAKAMDHLKDGDRVLISEGCTHHRQCEDIGTVKLPGWITAHTGASLEFSFTSGVEFPEDLSPYALIVHCGACTLNPREVSHRMATAHTQGIPFTNYGVAIAHINGILDRCLSVFG